MKKYKYTAIDIEKKKFSGIYLANSEEHLRTQLAEQNLFLTSYKVLSDKSPNMFFSLSGKISSKELTSFCRQLAIMITSSIELINCLEVLKNQSFTKYFRQILDMIYEDVKSGLLLSQAMEKHKKIFPQFFRNMVYVGEMSSSLDKVLVNVADYYENADKIRAKVKGAMIYPIILLCLTIGIIALMMLLVVPTFRDSLAVLEVEMPPLTLAIFNISDFVIQNWMYIVLGIVAVILFIKLIKKTNGGKYFFDTLAMKIGFIRKYQVAKVTSDFSRAFGLLLASGMNMVESMEVVEKIISNKYVAKKFRLAIEDVRKGVSLTRALEKMNVFPTMLLQMVLVGEKTASLDDVLLRSCSYFDEQLQNAINGLTALIQPVLMVIMGLSIGIMFIAVYSPMLSIMETIG